MTAENTTSALPQIAAQLTRDRREQRKSIQLVADQIGRSQSSVGQWETGARTPSLGALEAWAGLFGYRLTLTPLKESDPC